MTDLYATVFNELVYPSWESGLRRRPTLAHLRRLEQSQWWSRDELCAFQTEELSKLVAHAYAKVPWYRERFRETGLYPGDVHGLEDLSKLPLLTREEAARSADTRRSTEPPLPEIDKMTSGSSGSPLSFAYDRGSEYWRNAVKLRSYAWASHRPGVRTLHFWGRIDAQHEVPLWKRVKAELDHAVRREHYYDCSHQSAEALDEVVQTIRRENPSVIVCYAQSGAALARHIVESGSRDWPDINVICGAEPLYPADREALRTAFGPGIFETYGSRETMLLGAECEAHEGLHVPMENVIVELVVRDEHGERPAEPGEVGEVVVTDLHNFGMPFIRYVNGDLAVAHATERCSCGRALARIRGIEGRTLDALRDGAGRRVSSMFFIVMFSVLAHKVRQFQVVQHRDNSIDLKLVPGTSFDDTLLPLVKDNCSKFLPGAPLNVQLVQEIAAASNGKRRVVVVES